MEWKENQPGVRPHPMKRPTYKKERPEGFCWLLKCDHKESCCQGKLRSGLGAQVPTQAGKSWFQRQEGHRSKGVVESSPWLRRATEARCAAREPVHEGPKTLCCESMKVKPNFIGDSKILEMSSRGISAKERYTQGREWALEREVCCSQQAQKGRAI